MKGRAVNPAVGELSVRWRQYIRNNRKSPKSKLPRGCFNHGQAIRLSPNLDNVLAAGWPSR